MGMSERMTPEQLVEALGGPFDLSVDRKHSAQEFHMETRYEHFAPDGRRLATETYQLRLQLVPDAAVVAPATEYRCSELQIQTGEGSPITVPELSDWSYTFNPTVLGADEREPMWGIPQQRFMDITDGRGNVLPFSIRYAAYISFIDFHSINDVFTRPMSFGGGIQDLMEIGQTTTHPASFIEAAIKFGTEVKPGSTFKNGQVTLTLKGVSMVNGAACALVTYDAGESKLKIVVPASGDQESVTEGADMYKGDMYVDLATGWLRKATLDEYMVAETSTSGSASKTAEYTVRHILIRLA